MSISNPNSSVEIVGTTGVLWRYRPSSGPGVDVAPPVVEVDGAAITFTGALKLGAVKELDGHRLESTYQCSVVTDPSLRLRMLVVSAKDSPVLRFRYTFYSDTDRLLTKPSTYEDRMQLADVQPGSGDVTEVQLSYYNSMVHSYVPCERSVSSGEFDNDHLVMGPLLVWDESDGHAMLAYEHGSQYPDAYLGFQLAVQDGKRRAVLRGVKGSYLRGTNLKLHFDTIWMQIASSAGERTLLEHTYRSFLLNSLAPASESRKPYIFYNTWNYQGRVHYLKGKSYLAEMNEQRMLAEIDAAHSMGVEVFVIDTGWYKATGDWKVDLERFPNGLESINAKLAEYGMRLGLWFGPTTASLSSLLLKGNLLNRMAWQGNLLPTRTIWETEESSEVCLVSSYADDFADELIRCARDFGVRYFKWDAVEQYGCDAPGHHHGTEIHSPQERADSYAFQQPLAMARIVEKLVKAFPDAIVDFDVTESHRCVGLAFLSVGKYFLINNGPYYHDYNILPNQGVSWKFNYIFVHPGSARDWICRSTLSYDTWIPSALFLVHYLPDEPRSNQETSIGSLILGHGGIWGDLNGISPGARQRFNEILAIYKQVRESATQVALRRIGIVGGIIEAYEKIDPSTGRGLMVVFANQKMQGAYGAPMPLETRVISHTKASRASWSTANAKVDFDSYGHAVLDASFHDIGVAIAFFGVQNYEKEDSSAPKEN